MYTFERKQRIPKPAGEVWEFFSNHDHLKEMFPGSFNLEILSDREDQMYEGKIIEYRIEYKRGKKQLCRAEITECNAPFEFVEEQLNGPYLYWHHRHTIAESDGGVWLTDRVSFNLPFWFLGKLRYNLVVRDRVRMIFDHRSEFFVRTFDASPAVPLGCL